VVGAVGALLLATRAAPVVGALLFAAVWGSFTTVAQPWMGLQFETLLIESNAVFGASYAFAGVAPWLWVYSMRWLVMRLMLGAGAGKLGGGDPAWRCDGPSAMAFHYLTQPLPNALSRAAHALPGWWHDLETRATFVVEGPLALTFFAASRTLRWVGFAGTAAFNAVIAATGSYGHLHVLTLVDALAVLAEPGACARGAAGDAGSAWTSVRCNSAPPRTALGAAGAVLWWAVGVALAVAYTALTLVPLCANLRGLVQLVQPVPGWRLLEAAAAVAQRWHVCGRYNLFAHMTRVRWELILEGTADGGASWHALGFHEKPGGDAATLDVRPRTLPLGHFLRTDWRAWFLPLAGA